MPHTIRSGADNRFMDRLWDLHLQQAPTSDPITYLDHLDLCFNTINKYSSNAWRQSVQNIITSIKLQFRTLCRLKGDRIYLGFDDGELSRHTEYMHLQQDRRTTATSAI